MTTRSEVRDTRDSACTRAHTRPRASTAGWPILGPGEIDDLRLFLQDVLQIPEHARRFTVTFAVGEAMVVSVDYLPRELRGYAEDTP